MCDEIETRRNYISDEQWERTSASWKQLKPLRNFDHFSADDETPEEQFARLNAAGFHLPVQVIEQWLYPHYYNAQTVDNYGWIDYRKVRFVETMLSLETLAQLYVIGEYRDWVRSRANAEPFDNFGCIPKDLQHWKTHHTWRVPPVVIDAASFQPAPTHAELVGPLQLVEGHTRLGYLYALLLADMPTVPEHKVFLLRQAY